MKNFTLALLCLACNICCFAVPPTVSSFLPVSAYTGVTVTITGTNFTGATAVSFGGVPAASFTVNSDTEISAVVGTGATGSVAVTNVDGPGALSGFRYLTTSRIITDFGGYWNSNLTTPNPTNPDSSHALLGFTYNGITFSTGVNDAILNTQGVTYTPGNFRALPVAGVAGVTGSTSTYLALAKKVDGSLNVANRPAVANFSVKSVLTDGPKGLDLGTGVTNLPTSAVLTFQIFSLDPTRIPDNEPDILLTQIADPSAGNDVFSFVDGAGNVIGNALSQDMNVLPSFGTYLLDLFNLTPGTPYNTATAYSAVTATNTRGIRLVGFKLSDFGISGANFAQVRALRITPSANSDYAFIAYNANAVNLTPNVSHNTALTNTTICGAGTANLVVVGAAANGGALTYSWEESTDGGTNWTPVADGGNYAGATTNKLSVTNAVDGYLYRGIVFEAGNANPATSATFNITVLPNPEAPSNVTVSATGSTCLNTPVQLTSSVTGGSNLSYQWQTDASGSFQNIPDATWSRYLPPVDQTGATSYRLVVSSGSGCLPTLTSATPAVITVTGIASTTPAEICESGSVVLNATSSSGSVSWYADDAGGSALATANSFPTPALSTTTTYYAVSSACPAALRVPVVATVHPTTAGGTVAGGTTVVSGTNSTTLTLNSSTGDIVNWQSSTDNFNVINNIANTSNQLTVTNLTETTQYRALVQSGTCASAFSASATITVSGTLPIHIGSLKATRENDGIQVQWIAYDQGNTERYEIERSSDGVNFTRVQTIAVTGTNNGDVNYQWLDQNPVQGTNYYRIKEVYMSGNSDYSSVVKLLFKNGNPGISLYPNPTTTKNLFVQFNDMSAGVYKVNCMNSAGQMVYQGTLTHAGGYRSAPLQLPGKLTAGLYRIVITSPSGVKTNSSVIINR
jgi:hypothetical protein